MKTRAAQALDKLGIPYEIREFQTGYSRGGVSPLGGKKSYPIYLDRSALEQPIVSVSAGMRGMQLFLKPDDLVRATHTKVAPIGTSEEE